MPGPMERPPHGLRTYRPRGGVADLHVWVLECVEQEAEAHDDQLRELVGRRPLEDGAKRKGGRLPAAPVLRRQLLVDVGLRVRNGKPSHSTTARAPAPSPGRMALGRPCCGDHAALSGIVPRPPRCSQGRCGRKRASDFIIVRRTACGAHWAPPAVPWRDVPHGAPRDCSPAGLETAVSRSHADLRAPPPLPSTISSTTTCTTCIHNVAFR
jgi:hypothetical protein